MIRPRRPVDNDADAPEWWRRSAALRRVPFVAAVVLVVILVKATQSNPPPALKTSCTTPAFALSSYKSQPHRALQWSATGPPGLQFELTIGVSGFVTTKGTLVAVPDPGLTAKQTQAASPQRTMDKDCKADGPFGLIVPPGAYTVRMVKLTGTRAIPSAATVAQRRLVVTP